MSDDKVRAYFWRAYLLFLLLVAGVVVSAYAAECEAGTWAHPTNGFISPATDDICAWYAAEVGDTPHTCAVNSSQSAASITYNGGPLEVWARTGGAPACLPEAPASSAAPTERADLATTQEALNALLLGLVFFACVHGYSVGVRR